MKRLWQCTRCDYVFLRACPMRICPRCGDDDVSRRTPLLAVSALVAILCQKEILWDHPEQAQSAAQWSGHTVVALKGLLDQELKAIRARAKRSVS